MKKVIYCDAAQADLVGRRGKIARLRVAGGSIRVPACLIRESTKGRTAKPLDGSLRLTLEQALRRTPVKARLQVTAGLLQIGALCARWFWLPEEVSYFADAEEDKLVVQELSKDRDYTLLGSAWITYADKSIHLQTDYDEPGSLRIAVYHRGRETEDEINALVA